MRMLAAAAMAAPLLALPARAQPAPPPVDIVAAENVYGDVARQIGGPDVHVTSILNSPDQDPHLFEASPSAARAVSGARIVIYNGIGYDPWMAKLLGATSPAGRETIVVAGLLGRKPGDNPHLWYDPATMPALARALAAALTAADPAHKAGYAQRLARFEASMQPVRAKVAALHRRLVGTPVAATEPVFGDMLAALGMTVKDRPFQTAVMNDTEPGASAVAALEDDLRQHRVRLLVYNRQATSPAAARMERIARASHVPVLGVTETEPAGTSYQAWMLDTLAAVGRALPGP